MPCQVQTLSLRREERDNLDEKSKIINTTRARKKQRTFLSHRHATDVGVNTQHVTADLKMKSVISALKLDTLPVHVEREKTPLKLSLCSVLHFKLRKRLLS